MKPIKEQLGQISRALEFANAGSLAQLETMLESREASAPPSARKLAGVALARLRVAPLFEFSAPRSRHAAERY